MSFCALLEPLEGWTIDESREGAPPIITAGGFDMAFSATKSPDGEMVSFSGSLLEIERRKSLPCSSRWIRSGCDIDFEAPTS